MEAWNVYLAVRISLDPSCAAHLVAYQRIITSANSHHPLHGSAMILNSEPRLLMTPHSDGTSKIWTFGSNAFQVHLTSLTAGHAIIVVVLHTTHLTVPITPLLHSLEKNS